MKKISFTEKNDFVLRHKGAKYFSLDLDLFRRHFPTHRLNTDLSRANLHTFERLDGQMLYVLLEVVGPEDILAARTGTPQPEPSVSPEPQKPGLQNRELASLKQRLDELEQNEEAGREEIDALRASLNSSEYSIEALIAGAKELEKKAFNKKKASGKSSPA
jgi:hypothetical protein